MNDIIIETNDLVKTFPDVKVDYNLTDENTWHIKSSAQYFWEPDERIIDVLKYCKGNNINVHFIGRGSNVLLKEYFEGLVISTKRSFQKLSFENKQIVAGCGVPLPRIAKFAAENGLAGFEFLIGIPGNVGGGIMTNAGLIVKEYREIKDILSKVQIIDLYGNEKVLTNDEIIFGNRYCSLTKENIFIKKAYFESNINSSEDSIKEKMLEHLKERKRKQPLTKRTAGSVFKRPEGENAAGWYIEKAGLKGFSIGGAKVSEKHANWIENYDNAKAGDIEKLIKLIKDKVYTKFNINLNEEIHYI